MRGVAQGWILLMLRQPLALQEAFDAGTIMAEASRSTPLFFILFPGYSPSKDIEAFAASQDRTVKNGKLTLIAMGQVHPQELPDMQVHLQGSIVSGPAIRLLLLDAAEALPPPPPSSQPLMRAMEVPYSR